MKTIFALSLLALSSNAFAAPAVSYSCVGKNAVNGESVVFDLTFSDWGRDEGYTNQSITITQRGGEVLSKPLVYQLAHLPEHKACQTNEGESYLPATNFSMNPTKQGDIAAYLVSFKSDCGTDLKFDVKSYCFFQN